MVASRTLSGPRMTTLTYASAGAVAGTPSWFAMLMRYTLPAIWPSAGVPSGGTGMIERSSEVVPAGRIRAAGGAKTWAWGGCSGVASRSEERRVGTEWRARGAGEQHEHA